MKLIPTVFAFFIVILIVFLFLAFFFPKWKSILEMIRKQNGKQTDDSDSDIEEEGVVPKVEFPFKNLFDDQGEKLNIILISAPFRTVEHERKYEKYKRRGLHFCGISSYLEFPGKINNPHEDRFHEERKHDYTKMVTSWLHCFRTPPPNLERSGLPLLRMAEADLKDPAVVEYKPNEPKEYDFIYVCLNDGDGKQCKPGWNWYIRNWDLAKKCLEVMCRKYKLRGVIVGRENCEFTEYCSGIVKVFPFLEYHEFQKLMRKCRFLFVPNISDASPRVITEAICYNMPVLVNYNILGGWNNVIPGVTGEFFTDEKNVSNALDKLLPNYNTYRPREWFQSNRGKTISGAILSDFLIENYPDINNHQMKYATITI
jgi:hypothetical protein